MEFLVFNQKRTRVICRQVVSVNSASSFPNTSSPVIASKGMESDYRPVMKNVNKQLAEYNKILIDNLQGPRNWALLPVSWSLSLGLHGSITDSLPVHGHSPTQHSTGMMHVPQRLDIIPVGNVCTLVLVSLVLKKCIYILVHISESYEVGYFY